jgi:hypothetical protein
MSKTRLRTFLIVIAIAIVVILIWAAYLRFAKGYGWAAWTGLGEYVSPDLGQGPEYFRGKTLWDWLELLIIPVVLAGGAILFNRSERKAEREIADDRIRESTLQTYLDRMTELLLEKNLRTSGPEAEAAVVARARTLTVLGGLDAERKGALVRFLYEAHLIDGDNVVAKRDDRFIIWIATLPGYLPPMIWGEIMAKVEMPCHWPI